MIISNQDIFSDSQGPITATAASTNVLDVGAAGTPFGAPVAVGRDLGNMDVKIHVDCRVVQVFNNLTSLDVALQGSDDNSSWSIIATENYLLAKVNVLGRLDFPSALIRGAKYRYLRLNYTVNGSAPSTGKIFAAVVPGHQTN
jgi:hypothetical protein